MNIGGKHMLPKYKRIAEDLKKRLNERALSGGKLPTEKELCGYYQVSRQTVRQALHVLEQEGSITKIQGSGSYPTGLRSDPQQNRIAVLLPSDSDYIYARLCSDVQGALAAAGFSVSVYVTAYSVSRERDILSRLLSEPLAGLLIDPVKNALPNPNLDLYEHLWSRGCPTVFLQENYEHFPAHPQVSMDSYEGARALVSVLLEQGHNGIAGIFQSDVKAGHGRYLGYVHACMEAGISWREENVFWYSCRELAALQKKQVTGFLRDFIRQSLETCSGVIAQNDEIAYWLIKELQRIDRHVPEDVAVVSFDDSYLCEFSHPWITSLAPEKNPAEAAVQLLLAQLSGRQPDALRISYVPVLRESH
jgi:GntR family transcriptional regulator of arabinose operon